MAKVEGPNGYSGNIGNLNYYVVDGVTYVRLRRRKLTRKEKASPKRIRCKENRKALHTATKFSREMRTGVPEVRAKDSKFHDRIRSLLCRQVINKDYINKRGEKQVMREFIPAIRNFVSNIHFPESIANRLKEAKIREDKEKIVVDIPRVDFQELGGDEFLLWIVVNRMDLIKNESIASDKENIRIMGTAFEGGSFRFDIGNFTEDECLVASIGISSYKAGNLQKSKGKAGFVMLGY